ncbi:MAG: hypothetical protein IJ192_06445 [Clostridia bacterium]|nr:hypothetical protein [Clostridia bacterium]
MKKIILIVMSLVIAVSLTGCMGAGDNSTPSVNTDEAKDSKKLKISDYKNDLSGLEKYLVALNYIPGDCEPTEMMYNVIGAKDGDRYNFKVDNSIVYVELYEYDTDNLNDDAKRVINEVNKTGKFHVLGDNTDDEDAAVFDAELSTNGKYLLIYNGSTDNEKTEKRKKDFTNVVKSFHSDD